MRRRRQENAAPALTGRRTSKAWKAARLFEQMPRWAAIRAARRHRLVSAARGAMVFTMNNREWRLIVDARETGQGNMLLDEALAVRVAEGHSPPTLRIYAWPCHAISLGRHQPAAPLLNEERCQDEGIEIVRRPTGGKAVRHSPGNVTYSVIGRDDAPPMSRDVTRSYATVNQALVAGLGILGIRAAVRDPAPLWPETGVDFGCFESPGRHEIYWAGRKLAAGAQRRTGGVILQQGTIPNTETGADLAALLCLGPGERERLRRDLTDRTGSLARALDDAPDFARAADALLEGFRRAWGIDVRPAPVTPAEERLMQRLSQNGRG